jgi:hypothetical protein
MKNRNNQKLEVITASTLIVGVDIAKEIQWARFVDYRGMELGKAVKFQNNKNGFENILASIETICKNKRLDDVIVVWSQQGTTGSRLQII